MRERAYLAPESREPRMRTHRLLVFPAAALGLAALAHADTGPDFARDVEPILAAACVRCHASSIPQGQLRLDTRDGLLKGGASGPVVVAGQAEASSLYGRLLVDDPAKRMPWMSEPLKPGRSRPCVAGSMPALPGPKA